MYSQLIILGLLFLGAMLLAFWAMTLPPGRLFPDLPYVLLAVAVLGAACFKVFR